MKCDTAILGRVVGLLLAILTPGVACATDAQLVGDTHISSSHPSVNFGGLTNLHVGNGNTVLIQFDVQAVLPAGILSSQIAKADLVLYVNRVNNPGSLDLKAVTSPWRESAVTSNTAPSLGIVAVPPIAVSAANTYVTVDVTALVQGWVASPGSNNGISLSPSTTTPATFVLFDSKENDQTGHQPRLEITLAGPQGPQGLTGTTGAQGIQGLSGATGATGPQGLTGLTGVVGAQGLQGPPATFKGAWSNATTYATGDAVSFNGSSYVSLVNPNLGNQPDINPSQWALLAQQGIAGAIGATGATGAQGPIGLTGATGATGVTGATGATGATGPQGQTGLTGAVGAQGLQGPPATFKGAWSNATTYATGDAVSFNGSSYVSLVNSNLDNQPDTNPSQWTLLAQQGITGAIGATGATGAQGPIGL